MELPPIARSESDIHSALLAHTNHNKPTQITTNSQMAAKKHHHPAPQIPVSLREEQSHTVKKAESGIDFENLGKIFRILREAAQLTQKDFGARVHANTVGNLEKGKRISSYSFNLLMEILNAAEAKRKLSPSNADALWRQAVRTEPQRSPLIISGPISQGVAFRVWWEITTRKIALELEFERDVLIEVYDSWFAAFELIRQHAMPLPVAKQSPESETAKRVMWLCESLLNSHMRPHLTRWQAKFRAWHAEQQTATGKPSSTPQELQRRFPEYEQMLEDLTEARRGIVLIQAELKEIAFA